MDATLIFQNLVHNPDYASKVLPYLKDEYFSDLAERKIFEMYQKHVNDYKSIPTPEVIEFELKKARGIGQEVFLRACDMIHGLKTPIATPDFQFLIDQTEEFCRHQSCYNAISQCIGILEDDSKTPRTAIPEILKDAISISFNNEVGHDYSANVEERFKKLHQQTARISTGIDWIDAAYGGGIPRKTLSCWMAMSGGGKSMIMVHQGAHFYRKGYNVLYITLELAEERIGERIDANLMDIDVLDLPKLDLDTYQNKVAKIAEKTKGRFFIKEYPPGTITAQHIRALLDELKLKKKFVPDVLIVDYINLMNSSRYKASAGANSYTIVKATAEELRAIAVDYDLCCITATQMNRSAIQGSDPDMTGVSESIGLPATVDALFASVRNDELDAMQQLLIKCLKTRFSDMTNHKTLVGVTWNRMQVKDLGNKGSVGISQDAVVEMNKPQKSVKQTTKPKFADIEV